MARAHGGLDQSTERPLGAAPLLRERREEEGGGVEMRRRVVERGDLLVRALAPARRLAAGEAHPERTAANGSRGRELVEARFDRPFVAVGPRGLFALDRG